MTNASKRMNPIHFGSDLADIQIRINPEIPIRIADQILALVEFLLSKVLLLLLLLKKCYNNYTNV